MEKIILDNFKIFEKPTEFELGPITVLTGKNSSGKSSLIKALLFLSDYHWKGMMLVNDFNGPMSDRHRITNYDDFKNWKTDNDQVSFRYKSGPYFFSHEFARVEQSQSDYELDRDYYLTKSFKCQIESETISELGHKFGMGISPHVHLEIVDEIHFSIVADPIFFIAHSSSDNFSKLNELRKIEGDIEFEKRFGSPKELKANLKRKEVLQKYFEKILLKLKGEQLIKITGNLPIHFVYRSKISVSDLLISEFEKYFNSLIANKKDRSFGGYFDSRVFYKIDTGSFNIDYTGPDRVSTNHAYILKDKTHQMPEILQRYRYRDFSLREYYDASYFLTFWPKELGIGDEILIEFVGDQVGLIKVRRGDQIIKLGDMGFGVSQIACLLIKLQVILNETESKADPLFPRRNATDILIIEEPEANLHPNLQAKLADLFFDFAQLVSERGQKIIIETHSEYFIRRTQVLVKEHGLKQNPFKVYYFDEEKGPYEMRYREDGKFINGFGTGFLDESRKHTFDLL